VESHEYALAPGRHVTPDRGRCAMEWVAHLAGEGHTDRPSSASPVAAAFTRSWNDALADAPRQRLRPYLARMIGTAGDGREQRRAWSCADWLVRTCLPAALEDAGLAADAERLRSAPAISCGRDAEDTLPLLRRTRAAAAAARTGARQEAFRASRPADWPLRRDGARAAARTSGRNAALDASRAALAAAPPDGRRAQLAELAWAAAWDALWARRSPSTPHAARPP
jgi:hypothetical protein